MSLYGEYIKELLGDHIYETEEGFATYRFTDEKTVYILDIYVRPEFRKSQVGRDIADHIMGIAKQRGCTKMLGSVIPTAKGAAYSMKVLLAYGMVPESSTNNFILFGKEI